MGYDIVEGDYECVITLEKDYSAGTWFTLRISVWPGEVTIWWKRVLVESPTQDISIQILLNQNNFTTGDTLVAEALIVNDDTPNNVDVKVMTELPDGT